MGWVAEVMGAIFSIGAFKAPGWDGFHSFFYQNHWEGVNWDLWILAAEAF